jgi:hypothetical protein
MTPALKSTLMAMAAAALGMTAISGCASSSDPEAAPAAHETAGGEAKGGEGSCSGEGSCKGEGSCSGKAHEESKGGEGSCGEGSCS